MRKSREIVRQKWLLGRAHRAIAESVGVSLGAVSVVLALVCLVSALVAPHALGWILGRSAASATVLVLGTAGVVYGTVLAYSELPLLWRSWSPA